MFTSIGATQLQVRETVAATSKNRQDISPSTLGPFKDVRNASFGHGRLLWYGSRAG